MESLRRYMDRGRRTLEKSSKIESGAVKSLAGVLLLIVISSPALAGDDTDETDRIEFVVGNRVYVVPNVEQRLREYNAFLADQPEIFIAPNSKYKGAKGD